MFMVLAMIGIPSSMVFAGLAEDKAAAEQQIAEFQKKIDEANGNLSVIVGQIYEVQNKIDGLQNNIDRTNGEIDVIQGNITVKEEEIAKETEVFNAKKQDYYLNLRSRYEEGEINFAEMVLDSSNLTELINNNEYYRIVKDKEESKIQVIKAAKDALENQKKELETVKKTLADKKLSLESEQNQLSVEKQKLDSQKDYFATISSQYQAEISKQEAALADINAQIQASIGGGFAYTGNGQFAWVVPSSKIITSPFGYRTSPIFGGSEFHKGIDISASGGAPIVAAESGVVVYAQYNSGGFGNCVVINHGSGLMTLYAHMSSYSVSVGQGVSKGQGIGAVGSTGWSTGNHLHFQVTNNGDIYNGVVNPLNYL